MNFASCFKENHTCKSTLKEHLLGPRRIEKSEVKIIVRTINFVIVYVYSYSAISTETKKKYDRRYVLCDSRI